MGVNGGPDMPGVVTKCQGCGGMNLQPVFSLGYIPAVNDLRPYAKPKRPTSLYPADLLRCIDCELVQMGYVVDGKELFPPTYPYRSGTTQLLRDNFENLAQSCRTRGLAKRGDMVVDIGSNDGTLLKAFAHLHDGAINIHGIEPTDAAKDANRKGIPTTQGFLSTELVAGAHLRADLITCTNVFAHVEDVASFMRAVDMMLFPGGTFVVEVHWLRSVLLGNQFDVIYHEHLRYYSLTSLTNLLAHHGYYVFDAEVVPTHGGSLRVYANKTKTGVFRETISNLLSQERQEGLAGEAGQGSWGKFKLSGEAARRDLHRIIVGLGDLVKFVGVGAPSRASTLVYWMGLDHVLSAIYEVPASPKVGTYLAGTDVKIMTEDAMPMGASVVAVILAHHIADELMAKLRGCGFAGTFLVPLPEPKLVTE